eukprot:gene7639-11961_t
MVKFYGFTNVQLRIEDRKKEDDPWESDIEEDLENQIPETTGLITNEPHVQEDIKDEKKNFVLAEEWFSRCVSSEHAIGSIILCVIWIFTPIITENFILAHSGAYLINDLIHMLLNIKYMEGVAQSIVHHLAAIIGIFTQFYFHNFSRWLIGYFILTEASTPFVNLRWRLHILNLHHGKEFIFVSLLMSASFFIVRTIPLPIVVYQGIIIEGIFRIKIAPIASVIQIIGLVALCSLNSFWSYKIAAGWFGVIYKKCRRHNE